MQFWEHLRILSIIGISTIAFMLFFGIQLPLIIDIMIGRKWIDERIKEAKANEIDGREVLGFVRTDGSFIQHDDIISGSTVKLIYRKTEEGGWIFFYCEGETTEYARESMRNIVSIHWA